MSEFHPKNNVLIHSKKKGQIKNVSHFGLRGPGSGSNNANFIKSFENTLHDFLQSTKKKDREKGSKNQWLEWMEESDKNQFDLYMPGAIGKVDKRMSEEERIIYMEVHPSQQKLEQLKKSGQQFYDEDFPANDESLNGIYGPQPIWQDVRWQPISKMFPDAKIVVGKIEPNDIKQGLLGDCYFLAGLSALAEVPERIRELFLLEQKNEQKYYSVKMLYRGKWRMINMDEMIPFILDQKPAFSDSVNKELWVMILEKAWAKLYKSYKQIEAGFPQQILHDLTGAPTKRVFLQKSGLDVDKLWEYLLFASASVWAMVSCSNPGSNEESSSNGIVLGHAYTFLQARQLEIKGRVERIVQLRNPWGDVEYTGKWSDLDSDWNLVPEDVVKSLQVRRDKRDGVFFMSYEAYLREFRDMYIAEINDMASYVYETYNDYNITGAYFTIQIINEGLYSFQIDNTPERSFTGEKQELYRYPQIELEIKRIKNGKVQEQVGKAVSKRRTLCKAEMLKPGKYVAFAKINFDREFETSFSVTLAVYAEYSCGIYVSTTNDAIAFTGDPHNQWLGQFQRYIFKPIILEKLNSGDKLIFDYSQDSEKKKKKEEEQRKKKEAEELIKKQEEEKRRLQEEERFWIQEEEKRKEEERRKDEQRKEKERKEEERRKEERLKEEKEREKQREREKERKRKEDERGKEGEVIKKEESKGSKESQWGGSSRQQNMDHNFNDHFGSNFGKKRDPNVKVKANKKLVTKQTIKKTFTQVTTKPDGETKRQEVTKREAITTKQYGSRRDVKRKTFIDREEVQTRQELERDEVEPVYQYERTLKEKEEHVQNEKGEIHKKMDKDEKIEETCIDDEDEGIAGMVEWGGYGSHEAQQQEGSRVASDMENSKVEEPEMEERGVRSHGKEKFLSNFLQKERKKDGGIDPKDLAVLEGIAQKVINDEGFKKRNIIRYHDSDDSDDLLSFGR